MKLTSFLTLVLLGLSACGSADKPDARIAAIKQQHQEILAKQKASSIQETAPELVKNGRASDAQKNFKDLVQQSTANLASLDQLDASKSQEPAQIALVGELAAKETELLARAESTVKLNDIMLARAKKNARELDSLTRLTSHLFKK